MPNCQNRTHLNLEHSGRGVIIDLTEGPWIAIQHTNRGREGSCGQRHRLGSKAAVVEHSGTVTFKRTRLPFTNLRGEKGGVPCTVGCLPIAGALRMGGLGLAACRPSQFPLLKLKLRLGGWNSPGGGGPDPLCLTEPSKFCIKSFFFYLISLLH